MDKRHQNLYRALSVLNSLLFPVFILSLIEILNLSFLLKFGFIFVFLITASLKIYCMSAIGGCILEIISGEEIVFYPTGPSECHGTLAWFFGCFCHYTPR